MEKTITLEIDIPSNTKLLAKMRSSMNRKYSICMTWKLNNDGDKMRTGSKCYKDVYSSTRINGINVKSFHCECGEGEVVTGTIEINCGSQLRRKEG
jgi:hypothetical protein